MAKAKKSKKPERGKPRNNKYEEKLAVNATFEQLVKQLVTVQVPPKK